MTHGMAGLHHPPTIDAGGCEWLTVDALTRGNLDAECTALPTVSRVHAGGVS
jgi:hypothetical protein